VDRILVLVDDYAGWTRGLLAEHGFSALIEWSGRKLLFDAGQTGLPLLHNAEAIGIDLGGVTHVILSHGHYDHTGGLQELARVVRGKPLLISHPDSFRTLVRVEEDGTLRDVGMPVDRGFLEERFKVLSSASPYEAAPGLYFLGAVTRYYPEFTCHVPNTYAAGDGTLAPHTFSDDTAVALDLGGGLLVLTGCGHSGLANVVEHARRVLGKPVEAVVGGFHLAGRDPVFIRQAALKLREQGVREVHPGHCTGLRAGAALLSMFDGDLLHVGAEIRLGET